MAQGPIARKSLEQKVTVIDGALIKSLIRLLVKPDCVGSILDLSVQTSQSNQHSRVAFYSN
jgi:hypothetical protein